MLSTSACVVSSMRPGRPRERGRNGEVGDPGDMDVDKGVLART